MKTAKTTTIEKSIARLVSNKELSKKSIVYKWVSDLKSKQVLRPVYNQGTSWNSSSLIDKSYELISVLRKLRIEFIEGNDAPRGGKTGYFVQITTKIN